jgi:hypothetical protein
VILCQQLYSPARIAHTGSGGMARSGKMLGELERMSYLWREPHRLSGTKLKGTIGAIPCTPLDEALETTLAELKLFPARASTAVVGAA